MAQSSAGIRLYWCSGVTVSADGSPRQGTQLDTESLKAQVAASWYRDGAICGVKGFAIAVYASPAYKFLFTDIHGTGQGQGVICHRLGIDQGIAAIKSGGSILCPCADGKKQSQPHQHGKEGEKSFHALSSV